MIYGYCRVSRKTQNIERQIRNILEAYPAAKIRKEVYTGTKIQGRKVLDKLLRDLKTGDTIVFDSASRMSRNSKEAMALYEDLFYKDIKMIFLKEPIINSDVFKQALQNQIKIHIDTGKESTDTLIGEIIDSLNKFSITLAKEQIQLVFDQAQKEVDDLHQRTAEGLITAKKNGKRVGNPKGIKFTTKKSIEAKKIIKEHSRQFDGSLKDKYVIALAKVTPNTYYKYKRELREQEYGTMEQNNAPQTKDKEANTENTA